MAGEGTVADYTESKKDLIRASFASTLATMGLSPEDYDIKVIVSALAAALGRRLQSGSEVTITVQMTVAEDSTPISVANIKSNFATPETQTALTAVLAASGVAVTAMAVTQASGGGEASSIGPIVGGVVGAILAILAIVVVVWRMKRKSLVVTTMKANWSTASASYMPPPPPPDLAQESHNATAEGESLTRWWAELGRDVSPVGDGRAKRGLLSPEESMNEQ